MRSENELVGLTRSLYSMIRRRLLMRDTVTEVCQWSIRVEAATGLMHIKMMGRTVNAIITITFSTMKTKEFVSTFSDDGVETDRERGSKRRSIMRTDAAVSDN